MVGFVKPNVGHLEAAAGVIGVIKTALALRYRLLPPSLNFVHPNEALAGHESTLHVRSAISEWPQPDSCLVAAVSSFGVSGTNAHVILQQAPPAPLAPASGPPATADEPLLGIWPVSARTPAALCAQATRLREHLVDHPDTEISDVAYSLATTRTQHPYRAAITITTDSTDPRAELLTALSGLAAGRPHPGVVRHHLPARPATTVFVFPGQGAQYPGMGAGLYNHHPGFARALDHCDTALHPYTGWSVRDILRGNPAAPPLERVDVIQPTLFAVMVALAETLAGYGIVPDAVIGHSQGEIAAAHIAGALSLHDAAKIVALRSHALAQLSDHGAMASILLGADDLSPRLAPWGQQLSIAATNGPTHSVISGDAAAVDQFVAACQAQGLQAALIPAGCAGHSVHVEPLREQLLTELAALTPRPARIPLYSTVATTSTGHPLDTTTMDAHYWYANLRQPVHFHNTIQALLDAGEHTFVELSPHPVLAPAISDTLAATPAPTRSAVIPTLHRYRPDRDALGTALSRLHTHGHSPSWRDLYPHANVVALPTYPFEHRRYWLTPTAGTAGAVGGLGLTRAAPPPLPQAAKASIDSLAARLAGQTHRATVTHPDDPGHRRHRGDVGAP